MPISDVKGWRKCVSANPDPYGKACVDVARRAMEILDGEPGEIDCHDIICRADHDSGAGGITGFMAGCVASMISKCHSRGEEFRKQWNVGYGVGDGANCKQKDTGGVVNPALLTIG